jgi:mannose-1-phosphate guanylyltransferase/mannose-6-phosphate isomerase
MNITPVILCGGSGTRLWPLSRAAMPKQLIALTGQHSLLQETWLRVRDLTPAVTSPLVVCNEATRFLVGSQLGELGADPTVILEPAGRNTAPAAALAAIVAARERGDDALLLILPADHAVTNPARFHGAVARAAPAATAGRLVTFGVVPDRPETGYGYICAAPGEGPRAVERFVEKPDLVTAREYVRSGRYLWNSGMFLFSAASYLRELGKHAPDILAACRQALAAGHGDRALLHLGRDAFLGCRADSIDYAVMEKTDQASVTELDAGWSDVGSWAALHEIAAADDSGNALVGDVVAVNCRNSYLRSEGRLVGAVGLDGCVVVETRDAVLVAPLARAQEVKALVDELKGRQRPEAAQGREVFRPWGSFDSLESRSGYQVKRLSVLPGAVLSLQMHHRRAEHWVVVTGIARITLDGRVFDLHRNEHTFIPLGVRHRIENPGPGILEIIEVQIGDYLGEDDIVRFEDKYGRQGRTD